MNNYKVIYEEVPGSGLGDVLLGFISCFWLSKILNFELYSNNKHILNIFEISEYTDKQNNDIFYDITNNYLLQYFSTVDILTFLQYRNVSIKSYYNFYLTFYKNKYVKKKMIELCPDKSDCIKLFFQQIKLKNYVQEKINNLNILKNSIGIHIRTLRKYYSEPFHISQNGSKLFREVLDNIDKNDNTPILLSLDDLEDKKYFEDKNYYFTDNTTPLHCSHERNLNTDIKSFIDIYALGMCDKVIISFWSNFSRIAVLRKKTPFYIVKMLINDDDKGKYFKHIKQNEFNENFSEYKCFNIDPIKENEIFREGNHSEILSKILI